MINRNIRNDSSFSAEEIQNIPISSSSQANNQFLIYSSSGTSWNPATLSNSVIPNPLSSGSISLTNTTNQLTLGTTNTTIISSPAPSASRTYSLNDVGTNSFFIMSEGNQSINGNKTFNGLTSLVNAYTPR
jgi:hypothetical protein